MCSRNDYATIDECARVASALPDVVLGDEVFRSKI